MSRQETKRMVSDHLFRQLSPAQISRRNQDVVAREIMAALRRLKVPRAERNGLAAELLADLLGHGPLGPLLQDPEVTEIMINGPHSVYAERRGVSAETGVRFEDERHLRALIDKMARDAGRRIDEARPCVDLTLPDGTRVNIVLPPIAVGGALVTMRKARGSWTGLNDLIELGTLDGAMGELLATAIRRRLNILFSGGTGAGKTTLLELLSAYIDERERIVIIEDTPELRLRQQHVVRLLTRSANLEGAGAISLGELVRNALRMNPSRIILGEIRGPEALEYLQALSSGHQGSLAVTHAGSAVGAVLRMENLVATAGVHIPGLVVRKLIAHSLDLVVQVDQQLDGGRRITSIDHVDPIIGADGMIQVIPLVRLEDGAFVRKPGLARFMAGLEAP